MAALTRALTAHPISLFKKSPRFYLAYDSFWLVTCVALLAIFGLTGFTPLVGGPSLWFVGAFGVLLFALIWAHLTIHNCTHGNLPRSINRIVGELLGIVVLVRFASWDIVHMRHHKYSDHRELDPHPNFPSFIKTVWHTIVHVEQQLVAQYFDVWGDTPENRERERRRVWVSYGTNIVLGAVWFWILGPAFFFLVFLPTNVLAGLFVIHFNWATHNGEAARSAEDMRPVNLTSLRYQIGNVFFCGIYAHETHHAKPYLFNPARFKGELSRPRTTASDTRSTTVGATP